MFCLKMKTEFTLNLLSNFRCIENSFLQRVPLMNRGLISLVTIEFSSYLITEFEIDQIYSEITVEFDILR